MEINGRYSVKTLLLALAACLALTAEAFSANAVVVESRTVPSGDGLFSIGVYVENDVELMGVLFPFAIRSVSGGAFIAESLAVVPSNRLSTHLIGYTVRNYLPSEDNNRYWECGGGGFKTRGQPDFVSPDAFLYAAVVGGEDSTLAPGSDGTPPGGTPSLTITFGVGPELGVFEIDTTCITPGNHLQFVQDGSPPVKVNASFTKGTIEVGCECDCHTDPNCDTYHDIVDWILIKNVAQGSSQPIPDPNPMCPVVTTDVNCDGVTNNTDKNLMYEVLFNGADPDTLFCQPCPE